MIKLIQDAAIYFGVKPEQVQEFVKTPGAQVPDWMRKHRDPPIEKLARRPWPFPYSREYMLARIGKSEQS